jgi:mono/diheme cytochrome c family protein
MRIRCRRTRFCAAALLSFGAAGAFVAADRAVSQETKQSEQQFQQLIRSVAGPDLFRAYCASCHSSDAKGHGPAARALKGEVPDLTALARHNKGVFPVAQVRATIIGDDVMAAHGSREMPVWGPIFHQVEDDVDRGNVRLENLVKYLESIQSVAATPTPDKHVGETPLANPTSPSGAVLYKRHCAACHGNDLKGNGPAPPPFKEWTPDLTTLATRHGGKFPDTFFANVLRNGVKLPAHGPAEMPIWGMTFTESEHLNENQVALRIAELASYVKSLQAK